MSAHEGEESHDEASTEEERRFEEALRQLAAATPVSPDFCARVLAATQPSSLMSATVENSPGLGAAWPRRRFRFPSRLGLAVSVLAAGLLLSLSVNVWLTYRVQDMATLRRELAATQAQVRAAQADSQQWQAHLTDMTRQLTALQEQAQRETQHAQEPTAPRGQVSPQPEAVERVPPSSSPAMAQGQVQARIGIRIHSGQRTAWAMTVQTVKAGDFLRVYVVPEDDAYVYVVHNDEKTPTLLNAQSAHIKVSKGSPLVFPAPGRFYQIDGATGQESITVICSLTQIREITDLFTMTDVPQANWISLERALYEKGRASYIGDTWQTRGTGQTIGGELIIPRLNMYEGRSLVVMKYTFCVQGGRPPCG